MTLTAQTGIGTYGISYRIDDRPGDYLTAGKRAEPYPNPTEILIEDLTCGLRYEFYAWSFGDGITTIPVPDPPVGPVGPVYATPVCAPPPPPTPIPLSAPPAPTNLSVTSTTTDSANLSWRARSGVARYWVQYATTSTGPWLTSSSNVGGITHTVLGLGPGTEYYFQVAAYGDGTTFAAQWGHFSSPAGPEATGHKGTIAVVPNSPAVGSSLEANLHDADGSIVVFSWQWQKLEGVAWTHITGATQNTYTPSTSDIGKVLRAVAFYADSRGSANTAESEPTLQVRWRLEVLPMTDVNAAAGEPYRCLWLEWLAIPNAVRYQLQARIHGEVSEEDPSLHPWSVISNSDDCGEDRTFGINVDADRLLPQGIGLDNEFAFDIRLRAFDDSDSILSTSEAIVTDSPITLANGDSRGSSSGGRAHIEWSISPALPSPSVDQFFVRYRRANADDSAPWSVENLTLADAYIRSLSLRTLYALHFSYVTPTGIDVVAARYSYVWPANSVPSIGTPLGSSERGGVLIPRASNEYRYRICTETFSSVEQETERLDSGHRARARAMGSRYKWNGNHDA